MARPIRKPIAISPPARVVLNWLAHHEARVYDFSEIAERVALKRPVVQRAITELRHPRSGEHLKDRGPDGLRLRARHAFLPVDAPARAGIDQPEHPSFQRAEHPSVTALRHAADERVEQERLDAEQRQVVMTERGRKAKSDKLARKLAVAKQRRADGQGRDEVEHLVPTLEEVIAAGYSPATAAGIVAEQQALYDGKTQDEAERLGSVAHAEAAALEAPPDTDAETHPWTDDEGVERALTPDDAPVGQPERDAAPAPTAEDNYDPPPDVPDDADLGETVSPDPQDDPPPDGAPPQTVSRRRRNK